MSAVCQECNITKDEWKQRVESLIHARVYPSEMLYENPLGVFSSNENEEFISSRLGRVCESKFEEQVMWETIKHILDSPEEHLDGFLFPDYTLWDDGNAWHLSRGEHRFPVYPSRSFDGSVIEHVLKHLPRSKLRELLPEPGSLEMQCRDGHVADAVAVAVVHVHNRLYILIALSYLHVCL